MNDIPRPKTLLRVSDQPGLQRFDTRPDAPNHPTGVSGTIVWAVGVDHLQNYLLPGDCPRVTCYTKSDSGPDEIARIIGPLGTCHLVAIKTGWLAAAQAAPRSTCTVDAAPFPLYR